MADGEQQKPTGSTKPVLKKRKLTSGGINTEDNSETTLTKTPESQIKTSKHFESDLTGITSEEFTTKAKELGIVISYELAQAAERQAHNVIRNNYSDLKHFESDLTGITSEEFTTKAKELGIVISYELAQAAERQAHNVIRNTY